jgi:hypothetical protein
VAGGGAARGEGDGWARRSGRARSGVHDDVWREAGSGTRDVFS